MERGRIMKLRKQIRGYEVLYEVRSDGAIISMPRELKFRAWDKDCCRFEYFEIGENDDYYGMFRVAANKFGAVVEQSTGLKDKNGKEIYEGDIVGWIGGFYEIYFDTVQGWRGIDRSKTIPHGETLYQMTINKTRKPEIIGNIHENPELIGGEE